MGLADHLRKIKGKLILVWKYTPQKLHEASRLMVAGLAGIIARDINGSSFLPTIFTAAAGLFIISLSLSVFQVLYGDKSRKKPSYSGQIRHNDTEDSRPRLNRPNSSNPSFRYRQGN